MRPVRKVSASSTTPRIADVSLAPVVVLEQWATNDALPKDLRRACVLELGERYVNAAAPLPLDTMASMSNALNHLGALAQRSDDAELKQAILQAGAIWLQLSKRLGLTPRARRRRA